MPGEHSSLSPSSISRWIRCPGSVKLSAQVMEPDTGSFFANEGTAAHHLREMCLFTDSLPHDFLDTEITVSGQTFVVDEEMAEALTPGILRIQSRPGRKFFERRVHLDHWLPGQFGTVDCAILNDRIEIDDLKYGAGVPVSPEGNEQMMAYALGFWHNFARHKAPEVDRFLLVIDQPRVAGGGGEWEVGLEELLDFGEKLRQAAERVRQPDPVLSAGETQCRFCRAKPICPELARVNLARMQLSFDDLSGEELTLSAVEKMTAEVRCNIVRHEKEITNWLKAVHASVLADAIHGLPTPGLKLAEGRKGRRTWLDPDTAREILAAHIGPEEAVKVETVSPAEAEKRLKRAGVWEEAWEAVLALTTQAPGKPALVPEESPREVAESTVDKFD